MNETALKAIINMKALNERVSFERWAPCEALEDVLDTFWAIRWDLPEGEVFHQQLIPNPHVNLMVYPEGLYVEGVVKRLFDYPMTGRGEILGAKFKIGGLNTLTDTPLKQLVNVKIPAEQVLRGAADLWKKPGGLVDLKDQCHWLETQLLSAGPGRSEAAREAERVVAVIRDHPDILSASGLAAACHLSVRTVQRLIETYTGVNPKWIIRIMRLQELKAAYEANQQVNWSSMAAQLGYADQAHLIKDFKAFFGAAPKGYWSAQNGL